MDELNQHECMASMTGLIGHMQRNSITPKIEQVSGIEERVQQALTCDLLKELSFSLCFYQV